MKKECNVCGIIKSINDYYKPPKRAVHVSTCRKCKAIKKRLSDESRNKRKFVSIEGEFWIGIKEAPDKYEISNNGRLRSLYRDVKGVKFIYLTPKILQFCISNHGYKIAVLRVDGKNVVRLLHRMFAEAFLPNPLNLPFINHKDGDKLNNNIENLEWCTQKENVRHAFSIGIVNTAFGENAGKSKLKENEVIDIFNSKEIKAYLAKKYKVSFGCIHSIKIGKSWKHLKLI